MQEGSIKNIFKCLFFGVMWSLLMVIVSAIITEIKKYNFESVMFVESIILIVIGLMSSIGGNPMGLSIQETTSQISQYITNANLEATKHERERLNIKTTITIGLSCVSLMVGGIAGLIISFLHGRLFI